MNTGLTVFVVDDDEEVRNAMKLLMISVGLAVETFSSAEEFLAQFDPSRPGCLLLDVRMKGMSGLEVQERLALEEVHPPIIIITGHGDVPMAVRAVKAGAVDFIEKPFNEQVLLDSVHRAIELDGEHRGRVLQLSEISARLECLTPREREILELVVAGKRNKTIASELGISQSTVEAHRSKVMEKMHAESLSHLMRMMLSMQA
jgi:RNA polymerase sigma factor (sigma-70 family)